MESVTMLPKDILRTGVRMREIAQEEKGIACPVCEHPAFIGLLRPCDAVIASPDERSDRTRTAAVRTRECSRAARTVAGDRHQNTRSEVAQALQFRMRRPL